ncbi:MAG: hypothetical protein A2V66_11560 [Ignavibacteria bacterium RBG_13_36_8]|nr:MAG: hypothetical protein A2V66_11560 [Ignavibacteria bacterium RBG_13_36_8]
MPQKRKESIIGILIGEAPDNNKASSIVNIYKKCPYCFSYSINGKIIQGIYTLPPDHKWWLNWVADEPMETMGLKKADVFFSRKIKATSQWLRGEATPTQQKAPCGAQCWECSKYLKECKGCPATLYHLSEQTPT